VNVGVPPSGLGTQPIGEVSRIVEGVFQLKLPVPLKFIASYLLPGKDGWTIIDPGFDYPPVRYHAKPSRAVVTALVTGVNGPARVRKGLQIVRPVVFLRAVG
jgi:glyoxylase-like metal-dependent hydrolase (beta-lactamase superfamily II)